MAGRQEKVAGVGRGSGGRLASLSGGILRLIRADNCVLAFVVAAVGASSAGPGRGGERSVVVGGLIVAAVVAFGNVVNDVCDEAVDGLSKPSRPLPAGRVSRREATVVAAALAVGAVGTTVAVDGRFWLFVLVMVILAISYSCFLKRKPVVGNLTVGFQVGSAFMFGALGAGSVTGLTVGGSVLIGWYVFGLEVAKTMEDQWADGLVGARTIAHMLGRRGQRRSFAAILVLQAATTFAVGAVLAPGWGYWLVLIPPIPLAALCVGFPESETLRAAQAGQAVRASKALWPVGLVALFLASR